MSLENDLATQLSEQLAKQIDNEILAEVGWQIMIESNPDWTLVELAWEKHKDTSYFWNEACAWAVENFGLPGENYMTHPTENNMKFLFKNEQDAILFALKWV